MSATASTVMSLIGGLGMFLFGMNFMSKGIEKAASAKLRNFLELMTKNRIIGVIFGAVFTAIIQSSSAATVMAVSFVNSSLMSLTQAAGFIMGANIGTTITSQLVSFKLDRFAPVILIIGVIMIMFCKKVIIKKFGEVVVGFGLLFLGISTMSAALNTVKDSEAVMHALGGLTNPALALLIGIVVTAVIQSSSVTVSILLLLFSQGMLELPICFYVILGCNIGACTSALLSSLSGRKEAKRAALIHFIFNVIGTIIMVLILIFGMNLVETIITSVSVGNPGRCIANAHTIFKVFQVIVLFPFAGLIVKMTYIFVPGEDHTPSEDDFELQYIGSTNVYSPATAVVEAVQELEHMGQLATTNLDRSINAFFSQDQDEIQAVYETEKHIDFLCKSITDYLIQINQRSLPIADERRFATLFHVVSDIERIGDHAENIADCTKECMENGIAFSKTAQEELHMMYGNIQKILGMSLEMFVKNKKDNVEEILLLENQIDEMQREFEKNHIKRMAKGKCSPDTGIMFSDLLAGLERVADHCTNIAFSVLEEDPENKEH